MADMQTAGRGGMGASGFRRRAQGLYTIGDRSSRDAMASEETAGRAVDARQRAWRSPRPSAR